MKKLFSLAFLRDSLLPQFLVFIGLSYPIARILLPGQVRLAKVIPLFLLFLWLIWRWKQPRPPVTSPLAGPFFLLSLSLCTSSLLGIADQVTRLGMLFLWGEVAVLLFLTIEVLAANWRPQWITNAVLGAISIFLLSVTGELASWGFHWLSLYQPGEVLFPVSFHRLLGQTHPNQAALLINLAVPLVIANFWQTTKRWQQLLWAIWLLLATFALFFASSRGSWLALFVMTFLLVGSLLWSAYRAKKWQRFWATLLLTSCYVALFGSLVLSNAGDIAKQRLEASTVAGEASPSLNQTISGLTTTTGRTLFWERAIKTFQERPLFGVGPEGFAYRYASEESFSRIFRAPQAHSIYFAILSEYGLAGSFTLGLLLLLTLWIGGRGGRYAPAAPQPQPLANEQLFTLACGTTGLGILVHGLVEVPVPLTVGMALCTVMAGLAPAQCWQRKPASLAQKVRFPLFPILLVAIASLAWGSSSFVLLQRNQWDALLKQARAARQQGSLAQSLKLYEQSIAIYPQKGAAYSERATVLAWQALQDQQKLSQALLAQREATLHDPTNYASHLNEAALLLALGKDQQAEAILKADQSGWAVAPILRARLREKQGREAEAKREWQQALDLQPDLAESAACLHSLLCQSLPLPPSEYAEIVKVVNLLPERSNLDKVWRLATSWNSVDLWAEGAFLAERVGDSRQKQRFLQAAKDTSEMIGKVSTPRLALALLQEGMTKGDPKGLRALLQKWVAPTNSQLVPQISWLLLSKTEQKFAQTMVQAAFALEDQALQTKAQAYLREVETALQSEKRP